MKTYFDYYNEAMTMDEPISKSIMNHVQHEVAEDGAYFVALVPKEVAFLENLGYKLIHVENEHNNKLPYPYYIVY